jgi:hypothetical protein
VALKSIERKPLKESGGLKKMEAGGIAKRRLLNSALDFVQNEEDILADLPEDLSPEEAHVARMEPLDDALNQKTTIKADLKRQGEAHKEQGRTDYHFVVCFADNDAATEFLRKRRRPCVRWPAQHRIAEAEVPAASDPSTATKPRAARDGVPEEEVNVNHLF